jgi:hypothetical protein
MLIVLLLLSCLLPSAAATKEKEEDSFTLSGDPVRWYPDEKVSAVNVQFKYKEYTITSDTMDLDLKTNIAVFKGRVLLTVHNSTVNGESLTLNLKTREWLLKAARTKVDPAMMQGGISGPVFLQGASISETNNEIKVNSGMLTTCDQANPHYKFEARDIEIYPGSRIVAHKVSVYVLGHKLYTLGLLVIPIKNLQRNILPEVGSTTEEGAYLKTSYAYMANKNAQGFLRLDFIQKRGIGTGIDQLYKSANVSGQASLYFLSDRQAGSNDITGRFQHQQKIGELNMNITANYQANNYLYYPDTTTRSFQLALSHNDSKSNSDLTFRNDSTSGTGSYDNFTTSLRRTQQFSPNLAGVLSLDMRSYNSDSLATPEKELQSNFELKLRQKTYDLSLTASKWTDLGSSTSSTNSFHSGVDRLPEVTFDTDSYKAGSQWFLGIPSKLTLTAGQYQEFPSGVKDGRVLAAWDSLGRPLELGDTNELDIKTGFSQAYYTSGMAQYVLRTDDVLTSKFGDYFKTRLTYDYQRAEGYSPFLFDYTGETDAMRFVGDYQFQRKLKWTLSTGYNFNYNQDPWENLTLRLSTQASPQFGFSVATAYDLNAASNKWQSLIGQIQVNLPKKIVLDLGVTYDLNSGNLDLGRSRIDLHLGKLWRIEGITSYDGTTKSFDYRAIRITRDLHCCEASITYVDEAGYQSERGISFNIRIKALPFIDRFGYGQYGQQVDTSMGQYYGN